MAEIRIVGVHKSFNGVHVINDLNLVIGDGEFFTIVGPSGCGKSTILNMIAGLEPVSGGSVLFDDRVVNGISPGDRDVAMVFQNYALYPHMTVYDNIAFPLRMKKTPRALADREVRAVAGILGLDDLLRRKPRELSGGQRQRVALGRAIVRKPKVFLMDEPLSNLDAQLRIVMRSELKKLHEQLKITTVYVTHDQSEAMGVSDRIAVLNRGDVQQCDAPEVVYGHPANTFVAGFIGSPRMNFLNGSIDSKRTRVISCNGIDFRAGRAIAGGVGRVTIGLRPEDTAVSEKTIKGGIAVEIVIVEQAGSFCWVDFRWGNQVLRGKAANDAGLRKGSAAYFSFFPDRIHLFNAGSGERIG